MIKLINVVMRVTTLSLVLLLVACNGAGSSNTNTSSTMYPDILGYISGDGVISTSTNNYILSGNQQLTGQVGINGNISIPTPAGILTMVVEPVEESIPIGLIESGLPIVNLPPCTLNIVNIAYLTCSFTITSTTSTINGNYNIVPTFTLLSTGESQQLNSISVTVNGAANPTPGNLTITPLVESLITNESTPSTISLTDSIGVFESITVNISSSNPNILTVTPLSCNITTASSCQVSVTAIAAGSANIIISSPNYSESQATFTVVNSTSYVYATNSSSGTISMYAQNPINGQLVPLNPPIITSAVSAQQIASDHIGKYVYVSNYYGNTILVYKITNSGVLMPSISESVTTYPNTIVIDPSDSYLYLETASFGGAISMFSINSNTGALASLTPSYISASPDSGSLTITSNGNYLYALYPNTLSSILMYRIESTTGVLSQINPESTIIAGYNSYGLAADPMNKYLYVTNQDGTISSYSINQNTGALTPIMQYTVSIGIVAGLAIEPTGHYLYAADYSNNNILMFSINQNTGVLTALDPTTVQAGHRPLKIIIDQTGHYLYVTNYVDNTLSMYSISQTTGLLMPLNPATVTTGQGPFGITIATPNISVSKNNLRH